MSADGTPALGHSRTNTRADSRTTVKIAPEPMVFFRPETNELLVVPKENATAFLNEVRLLDRLMYDSMMAKQACLDASAALLKVQRVNGTPKTLVPPHSTALAQAQAKFDAANRNLAQTQQNLEKVFEPLGELDGTGGKLYELVPIARRGAAKADARTPVQRDGHAWGKKWTYVRSDKIKSHFRSYQLNKAEQEAHQSNKKASFIGADNKVDWGKLGKQLGDLKTSAAWKKEVDAHGVFFEDLNQDIHDSLAAWAAGINGGRYVKLDPEVQLLRYFAGAGVNANWDPKAGNVAVRGNARAEFAIAEGKFSAACYFPGRAGYMLEMTGPKSDKVYKAGLVRAAISLELAGLAGASASAQLGVTVDYTDLAGGKVGMRGRPTKTAMTNQAVDIAKEVRDGADVHGALDVFAGARATGSVKGSLEWNNPEARKFTALCDIGPGGQIQAGGGASAAFKITFAEGKFRFLCAASACLGVGAGGKLEFEVDAGKTLEFSKYVAYMLYAVGYEFTDIFIGDAYKLLTSFSVWAIARGEHVSDAISNYASSFLSDAAQIYVEIQADLLGDFEKESQRITLMNRVLTNSKALEYATPEAKGIVLYQLTRHDFKSVAGASSIPANTDAGDYVPWKAEFVGRRKRAIVTVCEKIRSKAEFRNVMQHMTADGSKAPQGWQANFVQVKEFLDMGADMQRLEERVIEYYDELAMLESGLGLQALYDRLYERPVLGYPFVDNTSSVYIARAKIGDHKGFSMPGGFNPGSIYPILPGNREGEGRYV